MTISRSKKKTTFTVTIGLACLCIFLPACSRNTMVDAPDEVSGQEEMGSIDEVNSQRQTDGFEKIAGLWEKPDEEPDWGQAMPWDKVLPLRETKALVNPTNNNPERVGIECAVNAAELYKTPKEAGLDDVHVLTDGSLCYDIETSSPRSLDVSKASFLLCDIGIKNISLDVSEQNITSLSLVCLTLDEKELKLVGLPAYFSESVDVKDGSKYYHYELPADQSVDAKVGWWVDLEQCKKENLYVMYNFRGDEKIQCIWELDL